MQIEVKNLSKVYKQGRSKIAAVDGISLSIEKGDFLVIIGSSGSGKSTLLQLLGGLDRPSKGEVKIEGMDITKLGDQPLTKLRLEKLGFVFQSFNLIPTLTASQNIEAAIAKRTGNDRKKTLEMLERVGLAKRANHLPGLLSGGEQQRVAIARALINHPSIVLADEPTGNLDSRTGEEIMEILKDLNKKNNQTIILVTHSEYVKKYATKIVEMKDGQIKSSPGKAAVKSLLE